MNGPPDEYKVDMGNKVDHWFELYGKAVLDNTLQDRIELHKKQQWEQSWIPTDESQEVVHHHQHGRRQSVEPPQHQNFQSTNNFHTIPKQGFHPQGGQQTEGHYGQGDEVDNHQQSGIRQLWIKNSQDGKKKFSYVHQLLMEEEQEKQRLKNSQESITFFMKL